MIKLVRLLNENSDQMEEQGTKISNYEEKGPYSCGRCIHQKQGICVHPKVVNDPALQKRKQGNGIKINLEYGCCGYVNVGG